MVNEKNLFLAMSNIRVCETIILVLIMCGLPWLMLWLIAMRLCTIFS